MLGRPREPIAYGCPPRLYLCRLTFVMRDDVCAR